MDRELKTATGTGSAPRLWACGGGKGGVGKSVIIANLAVALARAGERCVLVDADLGGANLHTLLGIPQPRQGLAELFTRQAGHLEELRVPTGITGLELISGALPLMEMANPHHGQKLKLLRQLRTLETGHVLLDLGAGSTFNMLDFFLAAETQLLVVTPQPTSVENAYHFLKAAFFRRLKQLVKGAGLEQEAADLLQDRRSLGIRTPGELLACLRERFPRRGGAVAARMACFAPQVLVNQVRCDPDRVLSGQMATAARDYFGQPIADRGWIQDDERVPAAVSRRRPVLDLYPQSGFSQRVRELCQQLLAGGEGEDERTVAVRSV